MKDTRMKVQLFFASVMAMVYASAGYAGDVAGLKSAMTEKFNRMRIPVEFVVEDGTGNYLPNAQQWIDLFKTDSSSIYKNYSFSPSSGTIDSITISDTVISFEAKYDMVRGFNNETQTFLLTNGLHANVVCVTTSTYDWTCHYQFVDQNFGDRLNPNPIPSVGQLMVTTFMGPNKASFQAKLLEISTATVNELF
jgi:hypothetical protein